MTPIGGSVVRLVEALPPSTVKGTQRIDWHAVAEKLRQVPGQWGRIDDIPKTTATSIRQGKVVAFRPPEDWEVTIRRDPNLPPVRATLFLRYMPPT